MNSAHTGCRSHVSTARMREDFVDTAIMIQVLIQTATEGMGDNNLVLRTHDTRTTIETVPHKYIDTYSRTVHTDFGTYRDCQCTPRPSPAWTRIRIVALVALWVLEDGFPWTGSAGGHLGECTAKQHPTPTSSFPSSEQLPMLRLRHQNVTKL